MAVQPAAELSAIPEFPALSRRATGEYNDMAYDFGNHMGTPGPFVGEMNALAANVEHNAGEAEDGATAAATQAANASVSAAAAAAFAASALNAPGTLATSTTSLALTIGTKNLTLAQTGKAFGLGQQVKLSRNAAPATRMFGVITAFNAGTGAMTVDVTLPVEGSGGPYTDWDIALGQAVISGALRIERALSGAASVDNTDNNKILSCTGSFALSFAALASFTVGVAFRVVNAGTGDVTITPNGAESIDGRTSYVVYPGEARDYTITGSAIKSVVVNAFNLVATSSGTLTVPPCYRRLDGLLWSAGAGGLSGASSSVAGVGGGGCFPLTLYTAALGTTVSYTIGAGGAVNGGAGGSSSFGSYTVTGGTTTTGGGVIAASSPGAFAGAATGASPTAPGYGGGGGGAAGSAGGSSVYGGGGGGGANGSAAAGGTSIYGGAGGAAGVSSGNGSPGVAPGGAGGSSRDGSGAVGARGELRLWGVI